MSSRLLLRAGHMSIRVYRRTLVMTSLLTLLFVGVFLLSVCLGSSWLDPGRVINVLWGNGSQALRYQILELRLPRTLIGALAGATLALSGGLLQSVTRNPLASPDVLGITSGASIGAVCVYVLGWRIFGAPLSLSLPVASLLGALCAALVVVGLSWGTSVDGLRLILIGIGINSGLIGATHALLIAGGTFDVAQAQIWLTGDLSSDPQKIWPLLAVLILVAGVGAVSWQALTSLQLGHDAARSLGVLLRPLFFVLLGCSVLAAAAAVSATGPLAFVALVAPQCARLLLGNGQPSIACSLLCGALLVLLADLVARTLFEGLVSVGLVTAMIGGPVLLSMLLRRMKTKN